MTARVTISRGNGNRFALLWAGLANSLAPVLGFDPDTSTGLATSHERPGLFQEGFGMSRVDRGGTPVHGMQS